GGRLGSPDVVGCADGRNRGRHVLGEPDLRAGPPAGPDRLDGEAVAEDGVVADLVELAVRELEPGRAAEMQRLSAGTLHVEPLVAPFDERGELVDREVMADAVPELLGNVARVLGEGLRRLGRLP